MSSDIVSRWPVRISIGVAPTDLDDEGRLTVDAVERYFAQARVAYFDRCTTTSIDALDVRGSAVVPGTPIAGNSNVTISVNVVEVFPDRFTMSARIRPADRDGVAADARCSLAPTTGEVPNAMRDEFIALAHGASYTH
jgi:hypothetical protein